MSVLIMAGAVVAIDIAAKLMDADTITKVLRRNRIEALIGVTWLAVHVLNKEQAHE